MREVLWLIKGVGIGCSEKKGGMLADRRERCKGPRGKEPGVLGTL